MMIPRPKECCFAPCAAPGICEGTLVLEERESHELFKLTTADENGRGSHDEFAL